MLSVKNHDEKPMKKTLTLLIMIFATLAHGQNKKDWVTIKHDYYTTTFDKKLHYPVLVEWWNYKDRCQCDTPIPRENAFAPDPKDVTNTNLQPGYSKLNIAQREAKKKGYDRGHMCPAADNECMGEKAMLECFYFSNMAPQTHSLNAGDWKSLETRVRNAALKGDSIHVWCGSVGSIQYNEYVTVPAKCWKVTYDKTTNTWEAYIMDNTFDKPRGIEYWKVNVADVQRLTGFVFKQ